MATNYQELATFLGAERWTEQGYEKRRADLCEKNGSIYCIEDLVPGDEVVTKAQVELATWMFWTACLKAPAALLMFLTLLYFMGKWVLNGFIRR